jgi:hypothetical protein
VSWGFHHAAWKIASGRGWGLAPIAQNLGGV